MSTLSPGDRLPPESKLAEQFGTSVLTVREALRSLAQSGLLERRQGSGTYVADRRAKQHVAIVTQFDLWGLHKSAFYLRVLHVVRQRLTSLGVAHRLYVGICMPESKEAGPDYSDLMGAVADESVSAVVAIGACPPAAWADTLRARGVAVVSSSWMMRCGHADAAVGFEPLLPKAVDLLLGYNRRRIAVMRRYNHVAGPQWNRQVRINIDHDLRRAGVEPLPKWICCDADPLVPGSGWEHFRNIWRSHEEKPDGLIVMDDVLFRDVTIALVDLGIRVPEQVLAVAHANRGAQDWQPFPVARLEADPDEYAEATVKLLDDRMHGRDDQPREVLLDHRIDTSQLAEPATGASPQTSNPHLACRQGVCADAEPHKTKEEETCR